MTGSRQSVTIVGAGLAGSVLAAQLGQRGIEVDVYERRPDPRVTGAERGRSINLALSARGLAAITQLGLRQEVLARALPMWGRTVHPVRGNTAYQPYSAEGTRAIGQRRTHPPQHVQLPSPATRRATGPSSVRR